MSYANKIKSLTEPSFEAIRKIAINEIAHLPESTRDKLYDELKRGVELLDSNEHMCQYLWSFGMMHQAKLLDAFSKLPRSVFEADLEIVDWGCGQAMGTVNLLDYLRRLGLTNNVRKITLIEPAEKALKRGKLHVEQYVGQGISLNTIADYFQNVDTGSFTADRGNHVIHIFSNILDVEDIDLRHLARMIDSSVVTDNYLICVGPLNPNNQRIDGFCNYFDEGLIDFIYRFETYDFKDRKWTYKARVFKLESSQKGHLIPIEFYPAVQFHAAAELDMIRNNRKDKKIDFPELLKHFEVVAPFDLGASVYDDVHPVLAVLHNILVRGLPTKSGVYIEQVFSQSFGLSKREVSYGEIRYEGKRIVDTESIFQIGEDILNNGLEIQEKNKVDLQLVYTPLAIARFQKVLLEALITGHLDLNKERWNVLVEEEDVPFSAIALEDFRQLFYNLTSMTEKYGDLKLPEIELHVISNNVFADSPLHLGAKVYRDVSTQLLHRSFDFVVTQSIFKSIESAVDAFSRFKAENLCYFNIRSCVRKRTERVIYTSDLIAYKPLVTKSFQGVYTDVEDQKEHLSYFLQLLFRKESFRPGQLPILDRALRNLPVIGLLPTGGGKSLTYQIAALIQPGVTMVIDPLKSLMKDQFDGLISSGIDCCTFINGSLHKDERKKRENKLESSELIFVFLSPERLAIDSFRERLKNMHEYNVYFSYGVIDEVHCVSEWGHDFRFSYLHLGRNLYNYVRSKEGVISLFGLTATASFDVLSDVERELSGNGAFDLDSDVIVRYENTNRLELQYKIEKVPVEFSEDTFFDPKKLLDKGLPKPINLSDKWKMFEQKSVHLEEYLKVVPRYLRDLQTEKSLDLIKTSFKERQAIDALIEQDLCVEMVNNYYTDKKHYDAAGIIFCPHVDNTPLSVNENVAFIRNKLIPDAASFSGKDDDEAAIVNMERFRDNLSPLMIATKAFGMGIDKPNVRFTVNLNYSSSLEAFVQEAGRAGRDRRMALATIFLSDYHLMRIDRAYGDKTFPLGLIKNKWFKKPDLVRILERYNLNIPEEYIQYATPENDIVQLHCKQNHKMFTFNECSEECALFSGCTLKNVTPETKGWRSEKELLQELKSQGLPLGKKHFQYLNPDYQNVMFFFGSSFKGDLVERSFMNQLLNTSDVYLVSNKESGIRVLQKGFLSSVISAAEGAELVIYVPYDDENYADLSKAIYRMCSIELIVDFTQDFTKKEFRIVAAVRGPGGYFKGLQTFLTRYYTEDRAKEEMQKVYNYTLKKENTSETEREIYRCLGYLTEFVYDKISEKRKRAIDDMRNFCIEGVNNKENDWIETNEKLKDFLFYYFNSKYAKIDYVTDEGEAFSLLMDTDEGKISAPWILKKYLRVIDNDVVGVGTPTDNVKHLYGAVRLISRSLTDTNPALRLLEVFCLAYLGTRGNENLELQLSNSYTEGMLDAADRMDNMKEFWELFSDFNTFLNRYIERQRLEMLIEETMFQIHAVEATKIINKYIS